jgi:hypothetical protein
MSWENLEGDPDAGKSNEHEPSDKARPLGRGTGRSNVQLIVLTPRGRVLHVVTGYAEPKELLWELNEALTSWKAVKKAAVTAELTGQQAALVLRQTVIAAGYKKQITRGKGGWFLANANRDRALVREVPLIHAGNMTTRMLTHGHVGHFGYGYGNGSDTPTRRLRETVAEKRINDRRAGLAGVPSRRGPASRTRPAKIK